jgi:hypothetical protein
MGRGVRHLTDCVTVMSRFAFSRALLAVVAIGALGACRVDTAVKVAVNPDGTGTVAVTVIADADVVAAEPGLAQELKVDDLTQSGWTVTGPTSTPTGGLSVILTHPFTNVASANAVLGELGGPGGPVSQLDVAVKNSGGEVRWSFSGLLDLSKGLSAFGDSALVSATGGAPWLSALTAKGLVPGDVAAVSVDVALPGTTLASAGASTTHWSAHPGDAPVPMGAASTTTSAKVRHAKDLLHKTARWLIIYLVALAAVVALWFLARRQSARPAPRTNRRPPAARRAAPPRSGPSRQSPSRHAPAKRPGSSARPPARETRRAPARRVDRDVELWDEPDWD